MLQYRACHVSVRLTSPKPTVPRKEVEINVGTALFDDNARWLEWVVGLFVRDVRWRS